MRTICALLVLLLPGCSPYPPRIKPPEPCQIWVRVDGGPWRCYERERVVRDLCKVTGC